MFCLFWVLVFVASFLRSGNNNNRLWGLSFWKEEDKYQVVGKSTKSIFPHVQNNKDPHTTPPKEKKRHHGK